MVTYKMPQQRKKEESEKLRGERDQIKFIDLKKQEEGKKFQKLHAHEGMNDDFWDKVRGLGSETWKGCE